MRRLIDELRNETRDLREQLAKNKQDETAIKMVSNIKAKYFRKKILVLSGHSK